MMNTTCLLLILSTFAAISTAQSPNADSTAGFLCIGNCEDTFDIEHDLTTILSPDVIGGKCLSNEDLAVCIKACKLDVGSMLCHAPEKCTKYGASHANTNITTMTTQELCDGTIETKECLLNGIRFSNMSKADRVIAAAATKDMQVRVDKDGSKTCQNIMDATVLYYEGTITYKSLEKIFAENSAAVQHVLIGLPVIFVVLTFINA